MKSLNWNCRIPEKLLTLLFGLASFSAVQAADSTSLREQVRTAVDHEYPNLFEFYKDLHGHPELSFHEERSAAHVAEELRKAGYEVTTGIGKYGVVAVLRNGNGSTVLVRSDLDGLPVKEQTGLPNASTKGVFKKWFGETNVVPRKPTMG